jgi:hypothetical protein
MKNTEAFNIIEEAYRNLELSTFWRERIIALVKANTAMDKALRDCVAVMDAELRGLAVIQPEIHQAKTAIEKAQKLQELLR